MEKCGLLDESLNYCMDYEYWLRLGKAGVKFAYLEKRLAGSRLYADNKTLGSRVKVHREINDMFKKSFGKVPDRWLFNYAHVVVQDRLGSQYSRSMKVLLEIGVRSLWAALYWNRSVTPTMKWTLSAWLSTQRKA